MAISEKVQFNVLMDPETVKLARIAAVGEGLRLSEWLDDAIRKRAGKTSVELREPKAAQ